jgi:hypothetical protein
MTFVLKEVLTVLVLMNMKRNLDDPIRFAVCRYCRFFIPLLAPDVDGAELFLVSSLIVYNTHVYIYIHVFKEPSKTVLNNLKH